MSLMYKLVKEGRRKERKKIARDLLGSGVGIERVKEVTGLSTEQIKKLAFDKAELVLNAGQS